MDKSDIVPPSTIDEKPGEIQEYNSSLNPITYSLRITFSDQTEKHEYLEDRQKINRWKMISYAVKDKILTNQYAYLGKITGGLEYKNKVGEYTYAHLHMFFQSTQLKDTIMKPIKRLLDKTFDLETTGNKYWSFTVKSDPDLDKIMRYPLKQGLDPRLCSGYSESQLELMHKVAHDSYMVTIQVNQKKMDNRDTSDTLFSKLCEVLKKENITDRKKIVARTIEFYVELKKPVNKTVILGYALTYQVIAKIITPMSLADEWL